VNRYRPLIDVVQDAEETKGEAYTGHPDRNAR